MPSKKISPKRGRLTFGQMIHRRLFAEAMRVYGKEYATNAELVDRVRDDIVAFKIATERSISKLNAHQKMTLVNIYLQMQGSKVRFKLPAKYDPAKRRQAANADALPTPDQRAEMERLFDKLRWPTASRAEFCHKQCGYRTPPTRRRIDKVIGALRSMDRRGWRWGSASALHRKGE